MAFKSNLITNSSSLPSDWHIGKVSDIADINKATLKEKSYSGLIEYIDITSVSEHRLTETEKMDFNIAPSRARRMVVDNDILISTVRPNLKHFVFIKKAKPNYIASTGFAVVSPQSSVEPRYLYYYLTSNPFTDYLSRVSDGGAYPAFNPSEISNAEIPLPPLPEQKAIALILGTLDDKIELNRKMNETLEAMARAIFKSSFTYPFEGLKYLQGEAPSPQPSPNGRRSQKAGEGELQLVDSPLGKIPKGWRVGTLGDICNARGGFAYKSECFCDKGYPVIKIKNIDLDRTVNIDDVEHIPENIALETQDFWLSDGDMVIAMTGATVGKFGLIINRGKFPAVLNQRVAKFFPFKEHGAMPWFIYNTLRSQEIIDQIISIADGSAQPNISANGIMSPKIVVPDDRLIKEFNSRVDCIFKQIISNQTQSRTLASIRDTLLPKLLSGEIRVKDTERFMEECL